MRAIRKPSLLGTIVVVVVAFAFPVSTACAADDDLAGC
jgi:hypothetical protein